jgi:hypothetical protein
VLGQVPLQDENPEVRRDATAHRMVVHRDVLEIFGLAKGDRQRVAVLPNLFLKTRDFPMVQ